MPEPIYIDQGATFDESGAYRYRLWRVWDARLPRVAFVMLNPSVADATQLDPTLRRCLGFARRWGCGSFEIGNLYALRSTDPAGLRAVVDPVGRANDEHLARIAAAATFGIIVGWGNHAERTRADRVLEILRLNAHQHVFRLGNLTAEGHPRHPLYLRGDLVPTLHAERRAA
jgi:hypothetical protein